MAKRDFAFGKENFILIAVAVACIVLGFILMSGDRKSTRLNSSHPK